MDRDIVGRFSRALLFTDGSGSGGRTAAGRAPPVGAPVVREGDFAVALEQALGVGTSQDEVQAESTLGGLGISPRNGWIADYPVTPDVFGELQNATAAAADAGKLPMSRDQALARLNDLSAKMDLGITPYAGGPYQVPPSAEAYPSPADLDEYYTDEGPPIVTYYAPPPDYYDLYDWIDYPFFVGGFFFPGYFCLNDFYRHFNWHGRPVIVSNHFNDVTAHRMFRIDPANRFRGNTFAGIGAPRSDRFLSTGRPNSGRSIFNAPRGRSAQGQTHGAFRGGPAHAGGFPGGGGPAVHGPSFHGGGFPGGEAPGPAGPLFMAAPGGGSGPAGAGGTFHGGGGGGFTAAGAEAGGGGGGATGDSDGVGRKGCAMAPFPLY